MSGALTLTNACTVNCQCTGYSCTLAVDASHLRVLLRTAEASTEDTTEALHRMIEAHRCEGDRDLISSRTCVRREITGEANLNSALPYLSAYLTPANVDQFFSLLPDDLWAEISDPALPSRRRFEEGDRRLTAAAQCGAESSGNGVWLVTDDEDFILNVEDLIDQGYEIRPVHSVELLELLWICGAVALQALEIMLRAEEEHYNQLPNLSSRKNLVKFDRLVALATRLGARTEAVEDES